MNYFVVPGTPVPQGGMRAYVQKGKAFVTNTSPGPLARYRSDIWDAWSKSANPDAMGGPIYIDVVFTFKRPDKHYLPANTKRPVRELREDAPQYMTQSPDIDKLLRAVLDALTGRAYADDREVAHILAIKVWGEQSQTVITLKEL